MQIRWFRAFAVAGVVLLALPCVGAAKEKRMNVAALLKSFSTAWPAERADYRVPTDDAWKAYARALHDAVQAGDDKQGEAALEGGLSHENRQVRALCARALGYVGNAAATDALARVLREDAWATVRLLAADSLGMLATPKAREALEAAQATERKGDVLLHLSIALGREKAPGAAPRKALLALSDADLGVAEVGKTAPSLSLETPEGKTVSLRSYRGTSAVVLVFIYGDG